MLQDIIIVIILTLLNGFFSMSEIALVTVRKTRIAELVEGRNKRAQIVQLLQKNPESLFAVIQIGVSVITIAASAFAGARIAENLSLILIKSDIGFIAENSYTLSFVVVVAALSYVSITIGELIPKSLGLRYAEPMALLAAYPIYSLSKMSSWLVNIFIFSSNMFLKLFNDSTNFTEGRLSEREIRNLISEGRDAGTVAPHEYSIIENVFDFSDLSVDKIMVPRTEMTAIEIHAPTQEILHKAIESGYSRIPVYKDSINNIVGILYTKRLLPRLDQDSKDLTLEEFLVPPYFVPSTMKISEVLHRLQKKRAHLALVTDEHGEIEGLVSLEDVLEEIVGDISDETDELEQSISSKEGDNFVVLGKVSIVDFNRSLKTNLPENEDFNTVSGFILERLGRFPKEGDEITFENIKFTVRETTARRVVKTVLVKLLK